MGEYAEIDIPPFVLEKPWLCPRCGATQLPSEVRTVEIVEPGKNTRVEFHGKIRPSYFHNGISYSCLVCGHDWGLPPEDPTPGGASVTFLHPIYESGDGDFDALSRWGRERDAC